MVAMLNRAGSSVWARHPGARLNVGELSRRGGGNISGHRSHENGRDVDVGFYVKTAAGRPLEPDAFVRVGYSGRGKIGEQFVHFDDERNWALVESLLRERGAPVRVIVVSPRIRRRLLRYARDSGAAPELIERAEWVMIGPERGSHHQDHFHVRVYCDPSDRAVCQERGPFWRWTPPSHLPTNDAIRLLPRTVRAAANR